MNWSRVKTIFILLFLISDLFLLTILGISDRSLNAVSPEIIESTVQILENNSIYIDPDIIPKKTKAAAYAEAENVISDYTAFAKAILGESAVETGVNTYESESGMLTITGNSFVYSANSAPSREAFQNTREVENAASDFLKNIGFDLSHAKSKSEKTDAGYAVAFSNYANGLPIFDSSVTVLFDGKSLASVSGTWFNLIDASGRDNTLKSVTSMLIDLIPQMETSAGGVTISSLSLGYSIPESSSYHKSAMLVPVWQVIEEGGAQHFPDARNPQ